MIDIEENAIRLLKEMKVFKNTLIKNNNNKEIINNTDIKKHFSKSVNINSNINENSNSDKCSNYITKFNDLGFLIGISSNFTSIPDNMSKDDFLSLKNIIESKKNYIEEKINNVLKTNLLEEYKVYFYLNYNKNKYNLFIEMKDKDNIIYNIILSFDKIIYKEKMHNMIKFSDFRIKDIDFKKKINFKKDENKKSFYYVLKSYLHDLEYRNIGFIHHLFFIMDGGLPFTKQYLSSNFKYRVKKQNIYYLKLKTKKRNELYLCWNNIFSTDNIPAFHLKNDYTCDDRDADVKNRNVTIYEKNDRISHKNPLNIILNKKYEKMAKKFVNVLDELWDQEDITDAIQIINKSFF